MLLKEALCTGVVAGGKMDLGEKEGIVVIVWEKVRVLADVVE